MADPAPDSAPRRRSRLARALLGLAVALVLVELGLRVVDLVQGRPFLGPLAPAEATGATRYQPHPFLGYALIPGGEGGVNALGLRGPPVARAKGEGVYRIVCLGGSTTYGAAVEAHQTWPARLERLLDEAAPPGRDYQVLNAGVPGYTSAESLVNLALRLVELQPDALIVYHAINDARLIQLGDFLPDYSHKRRSWRFPALSPLESALLRHCRIAFRLFGERYLAPGQLRLDQLVFHSGPHPPGAWGPGGVNQPGVGVFLRNVRHILALAEEHGIAPALARFARCPERLTGDGHQAVLEAMDQGLTSLARERGLPLLRPDLALEGRPELFTDYVHLTAEGCGVFARRLFEQARREGLWGLD